MAASDLPSPLLVILQRWKSHRQLFCPDWGSLVTLMPAVAVDYCNEPTSQLSFCLETGNRNWTGRWKEGAKAFLAFSLSIAGKIATNSQ